MGKVSFRLKFLKLLIAMLIITMGVLTEGTVTYAEENNSNEESVRVGFFAMDGYHMMDENGTRSGYGYDFLRLAARYWNVKYEYIGYDKSWEDMQNMLLEGKIDLVTSARKTEEREKLFDFSKSIGTNNAIMTVKSDNNSIIAQDYATYNGIRVALLKHNTRNEDFNEFAEEKGFVYEPVYYSMTADMEEALQKGDVDAIVTSSLRQTKNEREIEAFASSDFYVMVKKGNTELLDQINYAIDQLNAAEGDWKNALNNKYYAHLENRNLEFTEHEKEIIQQYVTGEKELIVTASMDRAPYSYVEDGELKGIIPDYFQMLADYIGIPYKVIVPSNREDLERWHYDGTADLFMDARLSSEKWIEDQDCSKTTDYMTMQLAMVTRRDFNGNVKKIAVAENQGTIGIEDNLAKEAERMMVSTREAAMQAVLDGKVDAAFVYLYTAQEFVNQDEKGLLTYTMLENPTYEYCMVLSKGVPHELAGIITKSIYAMPEGTIEALAAEYTSYKAQNMTWYTLIKIYPKTSLALGILIVLVLLFVTVLLVRESARRKLVLLAEQKAKEMEVLADKAQAANHAKSIFFMNMSHDIRTPMNAIVGILNIMEKDEGVTGHLREYVHKIQLSSNYLLGLINNVLDMSKIESGEVSLTDGKISLADQVAQIDSVIRPQACEHEDTFDIQVYQVKHEYVRGDAMRLRQVLVNLLTNALKYTPNGGKISLDIREIPCDQKEYAKYVFSVTDNGYGISREFTEHMYEPFAREENSVTNKVQGTGLGLAITKGIVDLMGGEIHLTSNEGEGTRFEVILTLKIDSEADNEVHVKQILLISKEKILRENVRTCLAESDMVLFMAEMFSDALEIVKNNEIEVILISGDIWKKQDLYEKVKELRREAVSCLKIFFLVGKSQERTEENYLPDNIDGFIPRPFFQSNLKFAIEQATSNEDNKSNTGSVLKGMHFLCAEDNELNASILETMLEMYGADCKIYPDGKELVEAFEKVNPGEYNAILMDVQMPKMNGLEATRAIRSGTNPFGKTIPIIAITANAFSEDVSKCLDAGMNAHIAKPIDIKTLETTVKRLVLGKN